MGPKKIETPAASPQELALQKAQADLLNQQRAILTAQQEQQKMLLPVLAEQAGFKVDIDPKTGAIRGITKVDDPLSAQRKEIEGLELDRSLKALKGELPVDPVLERQLGTTEEKLRERLRSQFGAGYETSTPGIQTLDQFMQSAEGLRSDARRGELTLSEQLSLAREGAGLDRGAQGYNMLNTAATGNPLSLFQAGGQLASGYGQAQIPFLQHRQMQMQGSIANAQAASQSMAGWGNLAGLLFGRLFPGGA